MPQNKNIVTYVSESSRKVADKLVMCEVTVTGVKLWLQPHTDHAVYIMFIDEPLRVFNFAFHKFVKTWVINIRFEIYEPTI